MTASGVAPDALHGLIHEFQVNAHESIGLGSGLRRPSPRHHTLVTPARKILSCDERRAGVKRIAHLGVEQFLELPRGFDHHRGALWLKR